MGKEKEKDDSGIKTRSGCLLKPRPPLSQLKKCSSQNYTSVDNLPLQNVDAPIVEMTATTTTSDNDFDEADEGELSIVENLVSVESDAAPKDPGSEGGEVPSASQQSGQSMEDLKITINEVFWDKINNHVEILLNNTFEGGPNTANKSKSDGTGIDEADSKKADKIPENAIAQTSEDTIFNKLKKRDFVYKHIGSASVPPNLMTNKTGCQRRSMLEVSCPEIDDNLISVFRRDMHCTNACVIRVVDVSGVFRQSAINRTIPMVCIDRALLLDNLNRLTPNTYLRVLRIQNEDSVCVFQGSDVFAKRSVIKGGDILRTLAIYELREKFDSEDGQKMDKETRKVMYNKFTNIQRMDRGVGSRLKWEYMEKHGIDEADTIERLEEKAEVSFSIFGHDGFLSYESKKYLMKHVTLIKDPVGLYYFIPQKMLSAFGSQWNRRYRPGRLPTGTKASPASIRRNFKFVEQDPSPSLSSPDSPSKKDKIRVSGGSLDRHFHNLPGVRKARQRGTRPNKVTSLCDSGPHREFQTPILRPSAPLATKEKLIEAAKQRDAILHLKVPQAQIERISMRNMNVPKAPDENLYNRNPKPFPTESPVMKTSGLSGGPLRNQAGKPSIYEPPVTSTTRVFKFEERKVMQTDAASRSTSPPPFIYFPPPQPGPTVTPTKVVQLPQTCASGTSGPNLQSGVLRFANEPRVFIPEPSVPIVIPTNPTNSFPQCDKKRETIAWIQRTPDPSPFEFTDEKMVGIPRSNVAKRPTTVTSGPNKRLQTVKGINVLSKNQILTQGEVLLTTKDHIIFRIPRNIEFGASADTSEQNKTDK